MRFCSKNQISKTGITVRAGGDGLHTGAHRGQGRKSGEVWRYPSLGDGSRREDGFSSGMHRSGTWATPSLVYMVHLRTSITRA